MIKEKLAFPSGTATAQLISVLHGEQLRQEKPIESSLPSPTVENRQVDELERLLDEDEISIVPKGLQQSWTPLIWSFIPAAIITVR